MVDERKPEGEGVRKVSRADDVAIFFKPKNDGENEVEIVSRKVMTTNFFASDWAIDIHNDLKFVTVN